MAFSLTACGGSSDSKTETNTESKSEEKADNDTDKSGEEETSDVSDMKVAMVTDSGDITALPETEIKVEDYGSIK